MEILVDTQTGVNYIFHFTIHCVNTNTQRQKNKNKSTLTAFNMLIQSVFFKSHSF